MKSVAMYAGIIVSELAGALEWYTKALQAEVGDPEDGWAKLVFPNGSEIELVEGDRERPGLSFPSYGRDPGPPIMPGYGCAEPETLAEDLDVARRLPDWIVVVAPDGLRVVITGRDSDALPGLVGFRYSSPDVERQQAFLDQIGSSDVVSYGASVSVSPVISADRDATLEDPDGTTLVLVGRPAGA